MTTLAHIDFQVPDWGEWPAPPTARPGYRGAVLSDGPLAYWRLGEASIDQPVLDASGHEHHAAYTGQPLPGVDGPLRWDRDTAVHLDGDTAAIQLPDSLVIPAGSPISVSLWARVFPDQVGQTMAFTLGDRDSPHRCNAALPWFNHELNWVYGGIPSGRLTTDFTHCLGRWVHVVLLSAGAAGALQAVYLDGVPVASTPNSQGPAVDLVGGWIGRNTFTPGGLFHAGDLDEFAVFTHLLEPQRIQAHYRAGVGR